MTKLVFINDLHQASNTMPYLYTILQLLLFASTSLGVLHNTENSLDFNDSDHLKTFEYGHSKNHSDADPDCGSYQSHHQFILLQNGSMLLPGSDRVHEFDSYYLANDTVFLCEEDDEQATESVVHDLSEDFLACGHVLIDPHEFEILPDGDVRIDIYGQNYDPRNYYMTDHGVYVCLPPYEEMKMNRTNETFVNHLDKFPPAFAYVTYAGLAVSVLSLLSHLVLFCLVPTARNLPGSCLASLSVSLLMAYACFLAVALMDTSESVCADLGMCVYYFFLTSFFWMNVIAFDVWRSFRSVMRELRISSHRVPWRRFLLYSLYSWAVPGLLVVLVRVLDSVDGFPGGFKPGFGGGSCWFASRRALFVFFAVPLVAVMVLNAGFFLDVTCVISRAALKTSHEATLRKRFFMFMRLALIMGLTWIVGLVAGYADHVSLWYAFIVLNTLQGLFIFAVFSRSSKVKGLLCCCSREHRGGGGKRGSTSVRISQISAQV